MLSGECPLLTIQSWTIHWWFRESKVNVPEHTSCCSWVSAIVISIAVSSGYHILFVTLESVGKSAFKHRRQWTEYFPSVVGGHNENLHLCLFTVIDQHTSVLRACIWAGVLIAKAILKVIILVLSDEEAVIYLFRMVLIKDTFLGLNLVLSAEESNWSFSVYAFVIVLCCVVLCRIDSQGLILLRCVGQKLHVTFGLGAGELVCSAVFMMSNTEHMDLNSGTEDD